MRRAFELDLPGRHTPGLVVVVVVVVVDDVVVIVVPKSVSSFIATMRMRKVNRM